MSYSAGPFDWSTLDLWSRRHPSAPAILALSNRPPLLWGGLPGCIAAIADRLKEAGVAANARIALSMPPGAEAATVCLAAMRTGIAVPLNPELTVSETASALERLRPHILVYRAGLPGGAERIAHELGVPTLAVEWSAQDIAGWPRLAPASGAALPVAEDDTLAAPDGTRMILQTSGTTAQPKLVPLTEENLFAAAAALIESLALTERDRALNLLPQFHIGGLWDLVGAPLLSGGSVICGGTFSRAALAAGCALSPSWVQLVPSMIRSVLETPTLEMASTLRLLRSVSAPLPPALKQEAEARLGLPVVEIYGMTETAGVIASNPLAPSQQRPGSVGLRAGVGIVLLRPSGEPAGPGEEGEVVVRGRQVSPGYLAASAGDAVAFSTEGFHTGDLGRMDADGHLWLQGRLKDLINRGGEMVSPAEIEAALLSLDGVADAAAFAVPHPTLGEEIEAAIVLAGDGGDFAGSDAALAALRPILGHGRVPARLHIIDALPRTSGGKLQRSRLAARFSLASEPDAAAEPVKPAQSWPQRPLARWIAEIWASVLRKEVMGGDEDFFQSGGTSLQAAQTAAIIQDRYPDYILYVSSVYEAPTPVLQAAFLTAHYPEMVARIIGAQFHGCSASEAPVTEEVRAYFRGAIADPLPSVPRGSAPNPPAVFILSPPRSGSTLLRAMLAGHPGLFAPPELYLLSHSDLASRRAWYGPAHASQLEGLPRALMGAEGCDADTAAALVAEMEKVGTSMPEIYHRLQSAIGERMLVDKTPFYGVHPGVLAACETTFDGAFYVHLSRHPYGMIRSFDQARLGQLWWPRLAGPQAGATCPLSSRQLAELIWEHVHHNVTGFLDSIPAARRIHVRYEDLVDQPEATCRRLCACLGIAFDPAMLEPLGDPSRRMTDGLRPGSRMIGDPKFHAHRGIDRESARRWKQDYDEDFLSDATWALADALGHGERLGKAEERIVFEV
ncbi:acyl-CoA synthetase (AMP-forming)/AMP-acid ligase II [Ancylobacter aquaticus]|uniref:Acyl-CoA synthetase (AMP-forming)/AMP-acid ligase II n=1 Tax=Ancylobacter aquaticus TaxID=100 RepID=A0A4R1IA71_ANCAQ|nr:AMP-binding protein [Ancylobacter aquaticus]TCK31153.1 acyl-CoA synthetase (AMP-forming)/AMP-acid ligase II [Ancylobacter aquaticus]